jgi:peptide alpha-N-acetyltransferase
MAVKILEAYEGTLEEDSPPDNERYEHSEMLLYKVSSEFQVRVVLRSIVELRVSMLHLVHLSINGPTYAFLVDFGGAGNIA